MSALRQYLSNIPLVEDRVTAQTDKLVQFVEEQRGELFDPADRLMKAVADVICGITFKDGSDTRNPDLDRMLKLNAAIVANVDDFQKVLILDFFPGQVYERWKAPIRDIQGIIRKRLRQTKETFDPTEPVEDFMSALLRAQLDFEAECKTEEEKAELFSEDRFVTTVHDMFAAGYETTSTQTLRFVIAFLVTYPKYQEDIQRELDDVLGPKQPRMSDRPNLPLVQAVILESQKNHKKKTKQKST
ncbi:Cytochrome P450 2J5 [Acropora cervicornis]|uniref:Cytochrome P450 2J5 n=1 Tax=Acropora cervicornis TaxID=6130 RepID=A0AAD9V1H4_ACRCE|nr:Cytochrome P450 2J5 [Acropora cervicornis]